MSEAFNRLSEVTASLTDGAEELKDLDDLMHTCEELQDRFASDPDLELKLQEE